MSKEKRQINIVLLSEKWGEINKGTDGMLGAPAPSIRKALKIAKKYYPGSAIFLEEKGSAATKNGAEVGR